MSHSHLQDYIEKANVLLEAIPYIKRFRNKIFIIKFGGSVFKNDNIVHNILKDLIFLSYVGIKIILVHGGSIYINRRLDELQIPVKFHNGIRVTDKATLRVVREILKEVNINLTEDIIKFNGKAISVLPEDNVIVAKDGSINPNLGYVGGVDSIDFSYIEYNLRSSIIVLSPMGFSNKGQLYNINADSVASALIEYLDIEKFVLLTDVPGIYKNFAEKKEVFSIITVDKVNGLIDSGVIQKGMIPKVQSCIQAIEYGAKNTHIVDARLPHVLLLEFFTNKGIGTLIK